METDLQESLNTVQAEGVFAFKIGTSLRENPYPEGHIYNEYWEKGFWDALGQLVGEHSRLLTSTFELKKKLDTAAQNIDYLRSRLSNYEDPDIGTYDHKDRMIRDIERGW
jgi:hypothetical protein